MVTCPSSSTPENSFFRNDSPATQAFLYIVLALLPRRLTLASLASSRLRYHASLGPASISSRATCLMAKANAANLAPTNIERAMLMT